MRLINTEDELYNVIKKVYPDLKKSEDMFAPYDCYSEKYRAYFELKCRKIHYNLLIIERLKYERLMGIAISRGMTPYYVCSTPQGVWRFSIVGLDLKWETQMLPETTQFEKTNLIPKLISYVDVNKGDKLPNTFLIV